MSVRRVLLIIAAILLLFLGVYTWNQRTGHWDSLATNAGAESSGMIVRVFQNIRDSISSVWANYVALWDVREENDLLRAEVDGLRLELAKAREEQAELLRLRELLGMEQVHDWPVLGARVMAGRMGPNAALETLMLSRGYLSGARPGTPVSSPEGLVGRVYKASPTTSVALLISDPGSRVAVISSLSRVQGILVGGGAGSTLELRYVRQNDQVEPGELLITSGMDSAYPKGIPVAVVTEISAGSTTVREIHAQPLVNFSRLEEVLLLERPDGWYALEPSQVYTRQPTDLGLQELQDLADMLEESMRPESYPEPEQDADPEEGGEPDTQPAAVGAGQ